MTPAFVRRVGLPPWAERADPDPHTPPVATRDQLFRLAQHAGSLHAWLHISGRPRARLLRTGPLLTAHALAADLFLELYTSGYTDIDLPCELTLWLENTPAIADTGQLQGYTGQASHLAQSNGELQTWTL